MMAPNRDHDAWLARFRYAVHQLFLLDFVTIMTVLADGMHVKHLGIDLNIAGSVLWLLCYSGMLAGTWRAALISLCLIVEYLTPSSSMCDLVVPFTTCTMCAAHWSQLHELMAACVTL